MPAYLVHRLAGEKAIASIVKAIPDENSYILGLQGGDLFFYRFHWGKKSISMQAGYALHAKHTRQFFEASMRMIETSRDNALISYFCGYIVHYCVDKAVHPFVFAHTHDSNTHNALEFMLDAWYYRDIKNGNASEFDVAADFGGKKLNRAVTKWYREILEAVYGLAISERLPFRAQKDFTVQRRAMKNNNAVFKIISCFIRLFTGLNVRCFMHPKTVSEKYFTQKDYGDMKEIIENAAKEASQKIEKFLYCLEGEITIEQAMEGFSPINFKGEEG